MFTIMIRVMKMLLQLAAAVVDVDHNGDDNVRDNNSNNYNCK